HATEGSFEIDFRNTGRAAAVFQVRSADNTQEPRNYTVEPGRHLADTWDLGSGYDLSVHGPNGFYRRFTAGNPQTTPTSLDVTASYHERPGQIILEITNRGSEPAGVTVRDGYTSSEMTLLLHPGQTTAEQRELSSTRGWYDLIITVQRDPHLEYHYAGHLETGEDSISDPAMGGLVPARSSPGQ